jgi:glycosyltransferase involved in cell wall biosynthesis
MNVLLLTDKLIHGGAENYFCRLENELHNPDLRIYTAAGSGELLSQIKHKENFHNMSRTNHLKNIWDIRRLIEKHQIDVIHANSLRMVLYLCSIKMLSMKGKSFKILYTKHNVTALEKSPALFSHLVNRYVDRIISVSQFERDNLIRTGVKASKVTTVYNGVDLEKFHFRKKAKREHYKVGILARLSEEKNHGLFLQIANDLRDIHNLMFYIAGDGPEREAIFKQIESLGLADKVVMVGNTAHPEQFIEEMDLLLLTSKREVFPMVMLEAMAVGTPLLTIDVGGVKEAIINNETGFLVQQYYAYEFCHVIRRLVEGDEISGRLIQQARTKVEEKFSMETMVKRTLNEYLELLHR